MSRRSSRIASVLAQTTTTPAAPQPPPRPSSRIKAAKATKKITEAIAKPATVTKISTKTAAAAAAAGDIPTLPFASAALFRAYMLQVGTSAPGVWLKIAKKATGIPTVTYDEAIDEALCCGWIDGQRRPLDATHFLQRFTPRRRRSLWSQRNVDKVASLTAQGRMLPEGQNEVDAAKEDGRWEKAYAGAATIEVPSDFREALDRRPKAARAFDALSKAARYPYLHRLQTVKKEETRVRNIALFVEELAASEP